MCACLLCVYVYVYLRLFTSLTAYACLSERVRIVANKRTDYVLSIIKSLALKVPFPAPSPTDPFTLTLTREGDGGGRGGRRTGDLN